MTGRVIRYACLLAVVGIGFLSAAAAASADAWFPHPTGATWQYHWSDSTYNPAGTVENVTVQQQQGVSFTLAWADPQDKPPTKSQNSSFSCPSQSSDIGWMSFQDSNEGLLNMSWASCPPPPGMPIMCSYQPSASNPCPNSIASALFNVIWGSRSPVLSEPLLRGTSWNSTGGADQSAPVSSLSQYVGQQAVKVPAFPYPVEAAVVRTQISQAGALGDPYGSGIRTTWWVYGVGPVKVVFDHEGGSSAPVTTVQLLGTSLTPKPSPPDANYFPLHLGLHGVYRWTNSRYLRKPEIQKAKMDAVVNRSARVTIKSVSGPIRTNGQYGFSQRLDGVTNIWGSSAAASVAKFPRLGHNRHFFTVLDLMTFGFNPLVPAYPSSGDSWHSGNPTDMHVYGVKGRTRILGVQTVQVPAGKFRALAVRSVLTQKGYSFGSGVRTIWFAPGRGLVKLVFKHRDGSTSLVQLIK